MERDMATEVGAQQRTQLERLIAAKVAQLRHLELQDDQHGHSNDPRAATATQRLRQEISVLGARLEALTVAARPPVRRDQAFVSVRPAVMVVEHNFDLLWLFRRAVEQTVGEACDVVALATGADACAQIALRPVPLVFVAEKLIDMAGIKVVETIKQHAPRTRIALTSNNPTLATEALAWRSGIHYYLKKPFALDDIMAIVRETLT
jgi:CheY-like chemotaxis protein